MPYTESPARLPGWTLLRNPDTKSVRYRSPTGVEVGQWAYKSAFKHYEKTGQVPNEPLGERWKKYQKDGGSSYQDKPASNILSSEFAVPNTDETVVLELPDPRPTPNSRSKAGLFTAREFADAFSTLFVILTSLIAVASQLPEAQMTDMEVKAISIPLANIIERSKYNKMVGSLVVGKSDWMTLGYALYIYFDRVSNSAKERRNAVRQSVGTSGTSPGYGPVGHTGSGNGTIPAGVALRTTPTGLRGITRDG